MTGRHLAAAFKVAANQNIKDRDYWLKKLAGDIEKSYFPYDKEPTGQTAPTGPAFASVSFGFPGKITAKLLELTRGSDYALHIYLAAGIVLLLHDYTGMEDILVGTPIYKQDIKGEFINRVILLRNRLRDNMTIKEMLVQVKQNITEAVEHQNYPLGMLPEQLNLPDDEEDYGFPLFDTAMLLENLQDKKYLAQINHNMRFSFSRNDSTLIGNIEYNSQLYEKTTTEKISSHFIELMEQALENLDSCITRLKVLSDEERERNIQWLSKKKEREVLIPPRGPYQEKLAEIWSEILNVEKERIGIDSNFFKLGGHSLKASRLVMRIQRDFEVKIPLTAVFAAPFIRALAREIAAAKEKTLTGAVETGKYAGLETVEKKEYYALSSAQSRIYILEHQGELSTTYNMPNAVKLKGHLQAEVLEKAFRHLVHRHESLRTSFHWVNGEPVQRVIREPVFKIKHYDISQKGNKKDQNHLEPVLKDFLKPFNLEQAPLLRIGLVKLQPRGNEHILLLDMHHIISDGISMGILVQDFAGLYIGKELRQLRTQFKDFIQWEYRFFETPAFKQQEKFWQENLNGELPRLAMPIDFKRPEKQTFAGSGIYFTLSPRLIEQLNTLARENDVTPNILLLSIYFLLLHKYTNQEDIIVGSVVSGRNHPDLEHMIGMFTNFLPIRNRVEPGHSFPEFLAAARERITSTYGNQDYPLEKIIDLLEVPIDLSRNPIFDTMLVFHNQEESSTHLDIPGLDSSACHLGRITSKLDFKLDIFPGAEADGSLRFSLEYNINVFKKQTMQRFIRHFKHLIRQVAAHPGRKISEIEIFSAEEKQDLSRKRKFNTLKTVTQKKPVKLLVNATFTSEPLEEYILWWGKQFGLDIHITSAPYNQVFQELLGENSLLSENVGADTRGINLLLIRFEDWIRELSLEDEIKCAKLEKNFRELERIIRHKEISSPYLVGMFPGSTHLSLSARLVNYQEDLNRRWKKLVEETANFYLLDFTNLGQRYQIEAVFDPVMDKEGHLPFTHEYYAAMGTQTARAIRALVNTPFKVIVLDCDNTLWQGICGEDGPLEVKVVSPYQEMQRLMLQKHDQGMLLTLCSKNNPTDVWNVFEKNPGMLLTRDHFVEWKINWQPKSKNIKELAAQLNLGPDSFIFIDDSAVECEEVITNCPEVLTLRLPANPGHIPFFLEHVWALDKMVVTTEDKERTRMYRTDKKRQEIREQAPSLAEFLSQLELKVSFNIMKASQVSRVTQLTQRTNQFNLSTRRRREDEITALVETPGTCCWVLEVSDRFGDYGLVGVVITIERSDHLFIDTFLLSCRVLGRGVEDAILTCLKKYLQECGLTGIKADYYPTPKNPPLLEFLQRTWKLEEQADNYTTYSLKEEAIPSIPAFAEIYYQTTLPKPAQPHQERGNHREISLDHISAAVVDREPEDEKPGKSLPAIDLEVYGTDREDWQHRPHLLPLQYCTAGKLLELPTYQVEKVRFSMGENEEPQNELQRKLAQIWQDTLKREKIGINMSFFAVGGNSLKAILMVSKIAKELKTALTLKDVFNHPTIKKLTQYISRHAEKAGFYSIDPVEKKEYYILSSAQKRLYFLQQMDKNSTAYNIFSSMILEGCLDKDNLERTIRGLIQGHESLRTSIEIIEEKPVQRIHEHVEFEIEYKEVEAEVKVEDGDTEGTRGLAPLPLESAARNPKPEADIINSFICPFDLTRVPLLRVGLIKLEEEKHIFLVNMHHIISDAMSIQVLVQDFSVLYAGKELPGIKLQYKDYSQWQNRRRASKETLEQGEYWKKEYEGEIPVLELPTDYAKPAVQDFEGNRVNFVINSETLSALKTLALETGVTLYILLLVLYTILLAKLSSQEDIVIGSPAAGRRHADLEKIIGMLVNTLALRNYPRGEKKFADFLDEVKERTLKSLENQGYPYEELVEKVVLTRDVSRNPLFNTLFVLQETAAQKIEIPGLELGSYEYENKTSRFDLTLIVMEVEGKLQLTFEYRTRLFKPGTIERFIAYFVNLIGKVLENRQKKISDFEIITEEERRLVLFDFNDTYVEYPKDKTIHELFAGQVGRTADHVALVGLCEPPETYEKNHHMSHLSHMSYRELNEKAHQLAHLLQEKGILPDNIVGIMVERSIEMIVGILGILKSGGAYLPIDPEYPPERIAYMLKDSNVGILLKKSGILNPKSRYFQTNPNDSNLNDQNKKAGVMVLDFEHLNFEFVSNFEIRASDLNSSNLAYVIYTSGTTGWPKGVLIRHQGVVNMVWSHREIFGENPRSRVSQVASLSFDAMASEVWPCLSTGACLCIVDNETRPHPGKMKEWLIRNQVTISFQSTLMAAALLEEQWNGPGETATSLEILRTAGDRLMHYPIRYYPFRLYNLYGPTEDTVWTTWTEVPVIREPERQIKPPPIGKPVPNHRVYILDANLKPQPPGIPGELCITGIGLARGYLNQPGLTTEKFCLRRPGALFEKTAPGPRKNFLLEGTRGLAPLPGGKTPGKNHMHPCDHASMPSPYHPVNPSPHSPIYRTGDLTRWLPDGNIEFLGRNDTQVKIRGFRVEMGEIENRLSSHPGIKEAVVLAQEEKEERYLCAYFVSEREYRILELRGSLLKELPDYMIPSYFVPIEKIPLTPNGKIDRKALPKLEFRADENYTAPGNMIEKKLAALWSEILGRDELHTSQLKTSIGIDDNFFLLGGHSLKATVMATRIHKEFDVIVPLAEVFRTPTIKELAEYIKGKSKICYISIESAEKKEYYELSPTQKRLYVLQQLVTGNTGYNMPMVIPLGESIQKEKLASVFKRLIQRHESLRTSFITVNEEPYQRIRREVDFSIGYHEITEEVGTDTLSSGFTRPFNLDTAPLLRANLIRVGSSRWVLFIDMHHIITDGTSQGILEKEFLALQETEELQPLRLQYTDYSEWNNSAPRQETIKRQESYWMKEFAGEIPTIDLPTDYPRPSIQGVEGNVVSFIIDEKETGNVKRMAKENNSTLYMFLLAVFNVLLSKLSGQEDIIIGTPIAARRHADLQNVIGMLVNTLPMRNYPSGDKLFRDFLKEVNQRTLDAYDNQEYPFEVLVDKITVNRDTGRNPVFDVMFNVLNQAEYKGNPPGQNEQDNYLHKKATSKFDINLTVVEIGERLFFTLEYSTNLFKPGRIEKIIGYYRNILKIVARDTGLKISGIEVMDKKGQKGILSLSMGKADDNEGIKTVCRLFEEQVARTPNHIAVTGQSVRTGYLPALAKANASSAPIIQLSYRELNQMSGRAAYRLREKGVGQDSIVGLMVERSLEMVIGMLGIMKAGGAYLPIDSEYPAERKRYMLEDGELRWLLVSDNITDIGGEIIHPLEIINLGQEEIYSRKNDKLENTGSGSDLLYVIYTSGSTGKPKGVMVEQHNLANLFNFQFKYTNIDCSRILQFSTISFDASFHEIFSAFLSGGQLFLVNKETRTDIPGLFKLIERNSIKTVFLPISLLKVIFKEEEYIKQVPRCIRHIQTAGDQVVVSNNFKGYLKERKVHLHNHYGPSETHVVTVLTIEPHEDIPQLPSIGKPVMNTGIYVVDKWGQLTPGGAAGEIWIGGVQVGRGYLNNPELTAERFKRAVISHLSLVINSSKKLSKFTDDQCPMTNDRSSKLYQTGDLARWLPDGNLEFLGRLDHQVKIRGFRVEPGEIESRLANYPGIKEVVVLAREEAKGDKYLCAYIVSNSEIVTAGLREYLSKGMPDYMIPSNFVRMEKIPLMPNGKVDRKALPKPGSKANEDYTAPRNKLERELVDLWSKILGIDALHVSQLKTSIGIDDNFFLLGGHSLKATVMVSRIHKELHVHVPLVEIFKRSTIRELAEFISEKTGVKYESIPPVEEKEYYQLSSAQRRLYFLQQMEPESVVYNIPVIIPLAEEVDIGKSEEVSRKLIKRHESLRTSFHLVNDEPVQRIHKEVEAKVEVKDDDTEETGGLAPLSPVPLPIEPVARSPQPAAALISSFIRPFDLARAPLIRAGVIKEEGKPTILIVDLHHIITDGTSQEVLNQDFISLYKGEKLPSLRIQYKDFAGWQNMNREGVELKQQELYWLKEFAGEIPVLNIPTDYPRPLIQSYEGNSLYFEISARQTRALNEVALRGEATLFMVLAALFNILLSKLSGQEDIVIGVPAAGRRHTDLEKIIGMFVNILALRNYPTGQKTFPVFLKELKEIALKAFENQEYQFEDLVEKVIIQRNTARNPLFDIMFVLQNMNTGLTGQDKYPKFETTQLVEPDLPKVYENIIQTAKFDLALSAVERGRGLFFSIQYCTKLFKKETVERFLEYFKKIVSIAVKEPDIKISDIEIVSEEEKKRILYDFNNTDADYPRDKTIYQLFEEQVEQTPNHVALVGVCEPPETHGKNQHMSHSSHMSYLSYKELNEKAHQLAIKLKENGVKPDTIVGIMVERSVGMVIGIYGILKAGGAYLPIDPEYPQERIDYLLKNSRAQVLVVDDTSCTSWLSFTPKALLNLSEGHHLNFPVPRFPSFPASLPSSLAYVIYTSGTTGRPKGVMIRHVSLVNFVYSMYKDYRRNFSPLDNCLSLTNSCFDVSVCEIFMPIIFGAGIVLLPYDKLFDPEALARAIVKYSITFTYIPPGLLKEVFHKLKVYASSFPLELNKMLVGVEPIQDDVLEAYLSLNPSLKIVNGYGPTEATICAAAYKYQSHQPESKRVPIGGPLANTQILLLDKGNHPVPVGIPGELCISGIGLARGYLNRPELTAERFCLRRPGGALFEKTAPPGPPRKNFLLNAPGSRVNRSNRSYRSYMSYIYRTGDLAKWLPDGNILFIGRIDQQVKIRGFRIELGEIEHHLLNHKEIKEAVVLIKEVRKDEKYLCAYIVPAKPGINLVSLREYLAALLPHYMVPGHFVSLECLPLSPSGKIDRQSLLTYKDTVAGSGAEYAAPGTDMEKLIARIWKEVLGLDKVGLNDRFFDVGGNSANILKVHHKLTREIGVDLPIMAMFLHPTVYSLAAYLGAEGIEAEGIEMIDNQQLDADKTMMRQSLQKLGPALYPQFPDEEINES